MRDFGQMEQMERRACQPTQSGALLLIVVSAIPTLLLGIRRVPAPERIGD